MTVVPDQLACQVRRSVLSVELEARRLIWPESSVKDALGKGRFGGK